VIPAAAAIVLSAADEWSQARRGRADGQRRVLDEAGGEAFVRSLNEALRIPEVLDFGDSAPKPRR